MQTTTKQLNQTKVNMAVDIAIFIAFLVAGAPQLTGLAVHEWLGIAFGAAIVTHLLLHWQWIVAVTRRFFQAIAWQARTNYILNALLFVDITLTIFSGLMISRTALPLLGVSLPHNGVWRMVHTTAADLSMFLIGLHIALHWKWVVKALKTYVIQPIWAGVRTPRLPSAPERLHKEAQS